MTISIIIIAHDEVGSALLSAATKTLGELPLPTTVVAVNYDVDPELLIPKLARLTETIGENDGVLILTDLFGSTPCNIARCLNKDRIKVISGLNLPMLIRVMNYPNLPLPELANKAFSGGKDGVIDCETVH